MKKLLLVAKNEKDVENAYRAEFLKLLKEANITSPFGVDGLLEFTNVRSLLEFKYQEDLKHKLSQCGILVQALYYLKKFEDAGHKLPNVIFVGDINECFAIHTNAIIKYLSHHIDWKIAPSSANKSNPELIQAMVDDVDILPFVFDVKDDFDLKTVVEKIKDFSDNVVRLVRVTEHNIETIFDYFIQNVLEKNTLSPNEQANLFINILVNPQENYIHPQKKNALVTKSMGEVKINSAQFQSFFKHFEFKYSIKEKEKLTSIVDRLVEDTTRRRKGEFFTPTIWVDEAHKLISENLGADWKDKYVVWDPAWGTGNLTRDYKFKELYCSTIEATDIHTANQMGYNPEAVKFQYDFLNDGIFENPETGELEINIDLDTKMPEGLKKAIKEGKPIVILMNPPYAAAGEMGTKEDSHKSGSSKNKINDLMLKQKLGKSSMQLYAQFLYRTFKIGEINSNIKIAIYSKPAFFTSSSFKKFRTILNKNYHLVDGFLFNASEFSDVSSQWGISFSLFFYNTLWNLNNLISDSFTLKLKLFNSKTFSINTCAIKNLYNTDDKNNAFDWVKYNSKNKIDAPMLSSSLLTKSKVSNQVYLDKKAFGYFDNKSNNVYYNNIRVAIFSSSFTDTCGTSIVKENFLKCTSLFTARKTITGKYANWINDKDEYLAPNENHPAWQQFQYDSLVYSLFNNSSQQSSLRQVAYKDKLWDIKNEFFWLSKDKMKQLAEENDFDALYQDARTSNERYVYELLFGEQNIYSKLSPDAKSVLDMATSLMEKSMSMRKAMSEEHPEYHLQAWDSGYAQMKLVWKQYFKNDFDAFRKLYKQFEDRMRPLVYELGFLLGDEGVSEGAIQLTS